MDLTEALGFKHNEWDNG